MSSQFLPLGRTRGVRGVFLKEPDGHAEMNAGDTGTLTVLEFLDHLVEGKKRDDSLLSPKDIPVADRDQILAAIYLSLYGSKIETTVTCTGCRELFDFSFSLHSLMDHISNQESTLEVITLEDGNYQLSDEIVFRLPTGEDELSVFEYPTDQKEKILLNRCIVKSEKEINEDLIEQAMMQVAPILEATLSATCPLCNEVQSFQFDIQSFLLSKLIMEKKELIRQVHLLASTYNWSHREILDLPRLQRQQYCSFIDVEKGR
jgi:hypothetical protein